MTEKVTIMILKVDDLQCSCCYKKIKKLLCKFPQIRDQEYDEKNNTVTITVIYCNPEKIRDKLCCKGKKIIKSIDIKEPKPELKPKPESKPKPSPPPTPVNVQIEVCCGPCSGGISGGPCSRPCSGGQCSRPCSGGPCYRPPTPPPCYPPRRPCYCYGKPCNTSICDCYTEPTPSACIVM